MRGRRGGTDATAPQPSTVGPPLPVCCPTRAVGFAHAVAAAAAPARRCAAARAARAARRASRPAGPQGRANTLMSRQTIRFSLELQNKSRKNIISHSHSRLKTPGDLRYQRRRRASYIIIIRGQYRARPPDECTHGRPPGGRPCCVPGIGGHRAPARACLRSDRPFVGRSPTAPRP